MNFNSEGRWGEKREALAQQGEAVLCEETVETQTALYEATAPVVPAGGCFWTSPLVTPNREKCAHRI